MLAHDEYSAAREIGARFDAPAFVRRARRVEEAWQALVENCRGQRDEWLKLPKLRLGGLYALAKDHALLEAVAPHEDDRRALEQLHADWKPRLRAAVRPVSSPSELLPACARLRESFARFNRRWQAFVPKVDLTRLNELRSAYNRFYVLEKECALRSALLAREGFVPLAPATADDLWRLFPLLPVPRAGGQRRL